MRMPPGQHVFLFVGAVMMAEGVIVRLSGMIVVRTIMVMAMGVGGVDVVRVGRLRRCRFGS
jgi:hypothetical protein